jgi:hypothetical protein
MTHAEEAVVAEAAEASQGAPRPRFPALDPEPPRRPRRTAALALIVLLAVAGGVSYATLSLSGSHMRQAATPNVSRTSDFNGIVLAETGSGVLSLTELRTGRTDLLKGLGAFGEYPGSVVSADDRFLIDPGTGKVLSLTSDHLSTVPNQLTFSANTTASYPWTDHDSYVLLLVPPNTFGIAENGEATLQSVQTGITIDLGAADSAAGDPQQAGAFFSVLASGVAPAAPYLQGPDSELVLADAGATPQVLATSAELAGALGFAPGTAVSLQPVVNPEGTMVAVQVAANNKAQSPAGIVVLSRSGQVLGVAAIAGGGYPAMSWSASGTSLAFVSGTDLVEWKIGAKATIRTPLPKGFFADGGCFWSPDNSAVLCAGFNTSVLSRHQSLDSSAESWVVIASGRAHMLAEHGLVLAWLTGHREAPA